MEVYFDENMPRRIAQAFKILLEEKDEFEIYHTVEVQGLGAMAEDLEIAKYVASRGGVIVTRDTDFKKRAIARLCREEGVGVFWLKLAKDQSRYLHIVELVAKRWQAMQDIMKREDGPYLYTVSRDGIFKI